MHICARCTIDCRTPTGLVYHEQARMRLGACLDLPPLPSDECEMVLCRTCRAPFKIDPAFAAHERVRVENGGFCGTAAQVQARMEAGWNSGRRPESAGRPMGGGRLENGGRLESGGRPEGGNRLESGGRPEGGNRQESGGRPESGNRVESGNRLEGGSRLESGSRPESDIRAEGPAAPKQQPDIADVPPGEEGVWRIVPETGKRFLSSISGKPVLDEKSRDFVLNFAKRYEPSRVGRNGKLL